MPVTLRDIAKHLGLSHATVSFVLNERHDVAIPDATRQRVFQAAREMGYRPNKLARALVSGRTQLMAITMPQLRHPYYAGVFHCLFEIAQHRGYGVLVNQSSRGPTRRAFDWPVDGVIVVDSPELIRRNEFPEGLPIVSIGSYVDTEVDYVRVDVLGGAIQAVSHLVASGCKKIVQIRVTGTLDRLDDRDRAYDEVLKFSDLPRRTILVTPPDPDQVRFAVRDYVVSEGKPDAFFCTNDLSALSTLRGMADLGFFAPKDYFIVGFDGIDAGEITVPSISTVSQPVEEMCRSAFGFLINRLMYPDEPIQMTTLSSSLVIRESSRYTPPI